MAGTTMTLAKSWLWPSVANRRYALYAIDEAFWVTICISAFTLIFALIETARSSVEDFDLLRFLVPVFLAVIAFGIRAKSRIAAISGFTLYLLGHLYALVSLKLGNTHVTILVALALLHGVRGTIAYHKFPPIAEGTPSIEQSFKAIKQHSGPDEHSSNPG
jgi:hypothetical protein